MSNKPLALIAGAGSGLGVALIEKFTAQGFHTIGLTRSGESQKGLDIHACDLSDSHATKATISRLIDEYGAPQIVVHNTSHLVIASLQETAVDDFENCWRNITLSAFNLAQATLHNMAEAGEGTFIVSGATASLRGGGRFHAMASAKFALRGLTQALAREFQSRGVHVVHTILDGIIDTPNSRSLHSLDPAAMMKPEDIANIYWQLAEQPRSTWTHELDLRPHCETF